MVHYVSFSVRLPAVVANGDVLHIPCIWYAVKQMCALCVATFCVLHSGISLGVALSWMLVDKQRRRYDLNLVGVGALNLLPSA